MDKRKLVFYLLVFFVSGTFVFFFRSPIKTTYTPAEVLGENTNLTLFIEPDDGREPLLNYIDASNSKILTEIYLFSDQTIIDHLDAAASRAAQVKVMLEEHPFGGNGLNQKTRPLLEHAGVSVNWTSQSYTLTHAKVMVFDDLVVCFLSLNLSKTAFTKNREYSICSVNQDDVTETENIFTADWDRKDYQPTDPNLVVSPINSRGKLTALINSAQRSLDIEIEVLADQQIINLLTTKSQSIPVRLVLPDQKSVANPPVPGTQTKFLKSPYPHAKLIIVDGIRAYVGSVNLSTQSMDQNRELGILVSQPNILDRLNATFTKDWERAI